MSNRSVPSYRRWRGEVFALTWLTYASFYLTRNSFSVVKVELIANAGAGTGVGLSRELCGLVDTAYLVTYALGQFFWGPLSDRFGARRVLLLGMALSVAAAVLSGLATAAAPFLALGVVQGLGQSTGWSTLVKVMSSWFSVRERGRVMGWWCSNYALGGAVAGPFAAWMMVAAGGALPGGGEAAPFWPAGFWAPAGVLLAVLLLVALRLRERPLDAGLPPIESYHGEAESVISAFDRPEDEPERSWATVGKVLRVKAVWMLGLSFFGVKLARYAVLFWGTVYVKEAVGESTLVSAITSAALPIGGVLGVILTGQLSDWPFRSRRMPVAILSLALAVGVVLVGVLRPIADVWAAAGFFFALGLFLFGPDAIISGSAAQDFGTKRGAGTAAGLINGIGSFGGILGGYLPGRMTSNGDWTQLFYVFVAVLTFSTLILIPLWNRRSIPAAREMR